MSVVTGLQRALERWHRLAKAGIVRALALYPSPEGQRVELIYPIPSASIPERDTGTACLNALRAKDE